MDGKSVKIIHAIFTFKMGGAESMLIDIMNRQCREASVTLVIIKNVVDQQMLSMISDKVNIICLNRTSGSKWHLLQSCFPLWIQLFKIKPDVIHCHDNTLFPFFIFWKKRTCLTVHSMTRSLEYLHSYRKIFAISNAVAVDLTARSNIQSILVYNGIELERYCQRQVDPAEMRQSFKIVQIGRLNTAIKGQDIAVQALSILKEKLPDTTIELYFVGEGDSAADLQQIAMQHKLEDSVHFLGLKDRQWIEDHLCDFSVLIQPSLQEGFGLTIIEGFAAGLPVVACRVGGAKEILEVLDAGLLVNPGDPVDLAEKIEWVIMTQDTDSLIEKKYVVSNPDQLQIFDIKNTVNNYFEHYYNYLYPARKKTEIAVDVN